MFNKNVFIVEHSSHFHTVIPWVKFFPESKKFVVIHNSRIERMKNFTDSYSENALVISIQKLDKALLVSIFKNLSKPYLVISTAPEHLMSINEMFYVIKYILLKPDILCIRNPAEWVKSNSLSRNKKSVILRFLSKYLLMTLAKKSKKIICESDLQRDFVEKNLADREKIFVFSGRLSDLTPLKKIDQIWVNKRIIGILGSVDVERRDYTQLIQSLKFLPEIERPEIAFLGIVKSDSKFIVEKIRELADIYFWSLDFVDEETFFSVGMACDLLIAPLNPNKEYGEIYGTGSFADAIALNRYLLLPSHIKVPDGYKIFVKTYDSYESLSELILRKEALVHPKYKDLFTIFGIDSIKKNIGI